MKPKWQFSKAFLWVAMVSIMLRGTADAQILNRLRMGGQNRSQIDSYNQAAASSDALGDFMNPMSFENGKQWAKFLRKLNLTDAQKSALKSLREESASTIKPAREKVAELRNQIHDAITADATNEAHIRDLSTKLGQAVGDAAILASGIHQKIKMILTPEQMARLKEAQAMIQPLAKRVE